MEQQPLISPPNQRGTETTGCTVPVRIDISESGSTNQAALGVEMATGQSVQQSESEEGVTSLTSNVYTFVLCILMVLVYLFLSALVFWIAESKWSYMEAFYFSVTTLTTIGYGDLVPSSYWSKWLVIFEILIGIAIIGYALGIIGSYFLERQELLFERLVYKSSLDEDPILRENDDRVEANAVKWRVLWSLSTFGVLLVAGVVFWVVNGWSFTDAVYFMIVTFTTVGYGDLVPTTTGSRAVMVFFMFAGTISMASGIGTLLDVFVEYKQRQIAKRLLYRKLDTASIAAMDQNNDGTVEWGEFLEHMLVKMGRVSELDIADVKQQFKKLDVDGSGTLDAADLQE